MHGLPYREIWALDFEFISEPGALPVPVCMVAVELNSGRVIREWLYGRRAPKCPFDIGSDVLFVAYFSSAEWGCFEVLGWPLPVRVIDPYVEFRLMTNGRTRPLGSGLLAALSYFGLGGISGEEKQEMRALVMRGGPYSETEQIGILEYCRSDVDCLGPLLERILLHLGDGIGRALLRGRAMVATARMEHAGVPIDVESLAVIRASWTDIKVSLIEEVDKDYGVYEGTTFKAGLFETLIASRGIVWPRLDTGRLALDSKTFRDMARTHPFLEPLRQLRVSLAELRLESLAVGPDGRNRVLLSPFSTATGRFAPSNSKFIFGPSAWIRSLIKPERGRALAYIDYSAQEVAVAAALSGDRALLDVVASGDPYLGFAKRAGLAAPDATKESAKPIRDMCKVAVLGMSYGMSVYGLSARLGVSQVQAQDIMRRQRQVFPDFFDWSSAAVDRAYLAGRMSTCFGWSVAVDETVRPNTLRNFPMQGNGAEILRLACCLISEAGVTLCAPVHDAVLIEGDAGTFEDVVAVTRDAMTEASRVVLDGLPVSTDVVEVRWPGRYGDARGHEMWRLVWGKSEKAQVRGGDR